MKNRYINKYISNVSEVSRATTDRGQTKPSANGARPEPNTRKRFQAKPRYGILCAKVRHITGDSRGSQATCH